jgi:hypothetical protein
MYIHEGQGFLKRTRMQMRRIRARGLPAGLCGGAAINPGDLL